MSKRAITERDTGRWIVIGLMCRAPTVTHASHASAVEEAKRLAKKIPGTAYYVAKLGVAYRAQRACPPLELVQLSAQATTIVEENI